MSAMSSKFSYDWLINIIDSFPGISETRLSDESPVFGLKKREKQQGI